MYISGQLKLQVDSLLCRLDAFNDKSAEGLYDWTSENLPFRKADILNHMTAKTFGGGTG